MQYMILIYGDERNFAALPDDTEAQKQMYAAYTRYGTDMRHAGTACDTASYVQSSPLRATTSALSTNE